MGLKINLLPPTRFQRAMKNCLGVAKFILQIPAFLLVARLFLCGACVPALIAFTRLKIEIGLRPLLGIKQNVSVDEAFEIARHAKFAGEEVLLSLEERLKTYKVYIEAPPSSADANDCRAAQITINIQNGRILATTATSCRHEHDALCG